MANKNEEQGLRGFHEKFSQVDRIRKKATRQKFSFFSKDIDTVASHYYRCKTKSYANLPLRKRDG